MRKYNYSGFNNNQIAKRLSKQIVTEAVAKKGRTKKTPQPEPPKTFQERLDDEVKNILAKKPGWGTIDTFWSENPEAEQYTFEDSNYNHQTRTNSQNVMKDGEWYGILIEQEKNILLPIFCTILTPDVEKIMKGEDGDDEIYIMGHWCDMINFATFDEFMDYINAHQKEWDTIHEWEKTHDTEQIQESKIHNMRNNNRTPRRPVMSRGARPNRQVVRMNKNKFVDIARKAATRLTEDYSANNTFNNPYTELNNELSEFGDVRVSGIYSNGLNQLCIAAKRGADTRAIKDFMKTKGYDYYTAGGNDDYLMMDFTRAKDTRMNPNRQVVRMNENKFVDIVCEVAMRILQEKVGDIRSINHGSWSDPEVEWTKSHYRKPLYNYWDMESNMTDEDYAIFSDPNTSIEDQEEIMRNAVWDLEPSGQAEPDVYFYAEFNGDDLLNDTYMTKGSCLKDALKQLDDSNSSGELEIKLNKNGNRVTVYRCDVYQGSIIKDKTDYSPNHREEQWYGLQSQPTKEIENEPLAEVVRRAVSQLKHRL